MKYLSVLLLFVNLNCCLLAQSNNYSGYGTLYRFELNNAPFPDEERADGHNYSNKHYPEEIHYNDSTTLVFIPDYYVPQDSVDIIVYFHGWNNNVDSALVQVKLIEQLYASGRNAVLIMPEGPKNAPDSFGGKLEEEGRFKLFIEEVLSNLSSTLNQQLTTRNIILAGHSGAYRVMSYILLHGGLTGQIKELYLFDGLYADVEKYAYWLDNFEGRFINIYTPNGGTKYLSENLMTDLKAWNIPFTFIDGDEFSDSELRNNRIVFISSQLSHNQVISTQDQFKRFLESGK
jgi:hypothetical protein